MTKRPSRIAVTPIQVEAETLVDRVTGEIRQSILAGRLAPGAAASISELATDLGVSHSPVREALQRLSNQGLVQLRPTRTAVVTPLTIEELHAVYSLCRLIEVDATGRSCPDLTDADIEDLEREFNTFNEVALDSEEFWRAHDAFHLVLMRPVMTGPLRRVVNQIWETRERYVRFDLAEGASPLLLSTEERHWPVLDAARTRDAETMRAAMTRHLDNNEAEIARSFSRVSFGA